MEESILDKVIDSQKTAAVSDFNPQGILGSLLKNLNDREHEVLNLRHGLTDNQKKTLEEIGNKFKVTRERIRQIENAALRKIKAFVGLEDKVKPVEIIVYQTLDAHGGLMHEDALIKKILVVPGFHDQNIAAASFIISQILSEKLHRIEADEHFHKSWKLPTASIEEIKEILAGLLDLIAKAQEPITTDKILEGAKTHEVLKNYQDKLDEQMVHALLEASSKVSTNPYHEWGLKEWNQIALKRMSDKIYLVLKKEGKPMHFTEIAKRINETNFDHKKANPATIHNELILDDKYVLVGRGIYALKEWGYKPGVVADVIEDVMREANKPLTREEIVQKVMAKRLIKRSTVTLALMNKSKFKKVDRGQYTLA